MNRTSISSKSPSRADARAQIAAAALNQSLLNQSMAGMLEYEDHELCQIHQGEPMIAVDTNDETLYGCNKCVFERRLTKPRFLATYAKRTKREIDEYYNTLVQNLEAVEGLEPNAFQSKVQQEVSTYFQSLYKQMREVERQVISKIKSSRNLDLLRESLEALH